MGLPVLKFAITEFGVCITTESKRDFIRRIGTDHVRDFRNASEDDIAYVRGMNGRVPEGRLYRITKTAEKDY